MRHFALIFFVGALAWSSAAHAESPQRIRAERPVHISGVAEGLMIFMLDGAGMMGIEGGYNLASWFALDGRLTGNSRAADMSVAAKFYMMPFAFAPYIKLAATTLVNSEGFYGFNPGSALGFEYTHREGFTVFADVGAYWWLGEDLPNLPFPMIYKAALGLGYRF